MRKIVNGLKTPAGIFVIVQSGVGFLNYLFQLMAGRFLPLVEFGAWSIWFAQFATTLLVAIWVQSLATLDGPDSRFFSEILKTKRVFPVLFGLSIGTVVAIVREDFTLALMVGWMWSVLQAVYFGRSLALGSLRLISVAMAVAAVVKLLIPAWPLLNGFDPSRSFYVGILFSPAIAVLVCAFFGRFSESLSKIGAGSRLERDPHRGQLIASSLILAVITAGAPQLDLLVAGEILDPVQAGLFGRVALVYKGFFFLVLIFAQLLLSKQIQGGHRRPSSSQLLLIPAAALGLAIVLKLVFPESWAPSLWVALGTFHIGTLTFLFLKSQMELGQRRWGLGLIVVLLGLFEAGVAIGLGLELVHYYVLALGLECVLIATLEGRKYLASLR